MYSHVACDVMKERTLYISAKAEFIDMALNAISFLVYILRDVSHTVSEGNSQGRIQDFWKGGSYV